jgi:ParB family transcriptional regulator, chromosome partitioning protein
MAQELPISAIRVGERVRREMGDIDALARSIDALGLLQPVVITQDCELIAGERRLRACQSLGWTDIPVRVAFIDAIALGERDENEVRKDFTISERVLIAQAVERALGERRGRPSAEKVANWPQFAEGNTRDIAAERAGFASATDYRRAKEVVERAAPELVEAVDAGRVSVSAAATVANLPVEDQRQIVEAGPVAVREAAKEIRETGHVNRTSFTGENEWFTPAEWLDRARAALGEIDLDPASNPLAQDAVKATAFFTKEDDALTKEWGGRVWMNPPYAQPLIGQFAEKLLAEIDAGRVTQALTLTHNYTDTGWFHALASRADAICFTRGRIRFVSPAGELAAPTQGQALMWFGPNRERFMQAFNGAGIVMVKP